MLRFNSAAAIDDSQLHHAVQLARFHGDGAVRRAGFRGVHQQIVYDPFHQLTVQEERPDIGRIVLVDGDIQGRAPVSYLCDCAINHLAQVGLR